MSKLESSFQASVIQEIYNTFPGAIVIKTDPRYVQGFPDLMIFYKNKWAGLECKASMHAQRQPNQEDWIRVLNNMSFAAFIYPENRKDVMNGLQQAFRTCW